MTQETTKEPSATDAITNFESKAGGFSNPNNETLSEAKSTIDIEDNADSDEEFKPYTYPERLEKLEVSDEEAHEIIDNICEKGSHLEAVVIRKKRKDKPEIKAVFMTRDTRTQAFISVEAAKRHGNIPMVYEKIMGELQLAASLVHYSGNNYPALSDIEDDKEFEVELMKRAHIFSKLPAPITVVLARKLSEFDLKITAVMAPGYEDFF
jgi:hypothetical protein